MRTIPLEDLPWRPQKCMYPAHFSGLRFGTSYDSGNKIKEAQHWDSLPERPKLRRLLENQNNTKVSCRRRTGEALLSCRKVWWLDDGGSQSPQWGMWIQRQSSVRCRGTRSCHSMVKIFTRDTKKFVKILGAVAQTESCMYRQLDEILESMWSFIMESLHFNTSSIRDKWHCWKSVRRVKEGASAVLLQSGLDEREWSDSMECYCYLRNVQDLLADGKMPYERRFGQPFGGQIIPFGAMVEYHPTSTKDQSRIHQFGKRKCFQ